MKDIESSILQPFVINWNLRNNHHSTLPMITNKFSIIGACMGEYPIDGWIPHVLEIPKDGHKRDLSGRYNTAGYKGNDEQKHNLNRTVTLPIYSESQMPDIEKLKIIVNHWGDIGIPDDIPCVAIAVKYRGLTSDFRESQHVDVLIIWSDAVARIVTLEWFEGPLEDCITPEWYSNSSSLLNLETALMNYGKGYEHVSLDGISYSICTIPSCFGLHLRRSIVKETVPTWNYEWKYETYPDFKTDFKLLISKIIETFSVSQVRCKNE